MHPAHAMSAAATTPTVEQMLTDHLGDDALEELICVYLQNRYGYLVRARTPAAAGYDYVLRNAARTEVLVHARSGGMLVARDADSLPTDIVDHVLVFRVKHQPATDADFLTVVARISVASDVRGPRFEPRGSPIRMLVSNSGRRFNDDCDILSVAEIGREWHMPIHVTS